MKAIIVQGMTCLGKSTLCRQLEKDIPRCKHFCLDEYREEMWDFLGFDSREQSDYESKIARIQFYSDIIRAVRDSEYDYILIEYVFTDKYWGELIENTKCLPLSIKTLYLKPTDLEEHRKVWESRSRDFLIRHAGHGATHYHNGVGSGYVNKYESKIFEDMNTIGQTMEVDVSFNPYSRSVSYVDILGFIKA